MSRQSACSAFVARERGPAVVLAEVDARRPRIGRPRSGVIELSGSANYGGESDYTVSGTMRASGLNVEQDGIRLFERSPLDTLCS